MASERAQARREEVGAEVEALRKDLAQQVWQVYCSVLVLSFAVILSLCLSGCLPGCLSSHVSVCPSVCMSVWLPGGCGGRVPTGPGGQGGTGRENEAAGQKTADSPA